MHLDQLIDKPPHKQDFYLKYGITISKFKMSQSMVVLSSLKSALYSSGACECGCTHKPHEPELSPYLPSQVPQPTLRSQLENLTNISQSKVFRPSCS